MGDKAEWEAVGAMGDAARIALQALVGKLKKREGFVVLPQLIKEAEDAAKWYAIRQVF